MHTDSRTEHFPGTALIASDLIESDATGDADKLTRLTRALTLLYIHYMIRDP